MYGNEIWRALVTYKNGAKYIAENDCTKGMARARVICAARNLKATHKCDWSTLQFIKVYPKRQPKPIIICGHFTHETKHFEYSKPDGGWDLH